MDISSYLKRINAKLDQVNDLKYLTHLQRQHLLHIPFENLDIHLGKPIKLGLPDLFEKVIIGNRGGFCYELNNLFGWLLTELGFEVHIISARVLGSSGQLGQEGDHLTLVVTIEKTAWLVDVGFGKFSMIPLQIKKDLIQRDKNSSFKISVYDDHYLGVYTHENNAWRLGYIFTTTPRSTTYFEAMCHYHQTSEHSNFPKRRLITMPNSTGRITLTDSTLKITNNAQTEAQDVNSEQEFLDHLKKYFGMPYEY